MDEVFKHWTGRLVFTQGVKWIADNAAGGSGAYWLIDACASWLPKLKGGDFIVFKLVVSPDKSAVLTADDGNGNIWVTQAIEWTDFDQPECELYCVRSPGSLPCLLQPCEY